MGRCIEGVKWEDVLNEEKWEDVEGGNWEDVLKEEKWEDVLREGNGKMC